MDKGYELTFEGFKKALKKGPRKLVYAWVNYCDDEGTYIEVQRSKVIRALGQDANKMDGPMPVNFRVYPGGIYIH